MLRATTKPLVGLMPAQASSIATATLVCPRFVTIHYDFVVMDYMLTKHLCYLGVLFRVNILTGFALQNLASQSDSKVRSIAVVDLYAGF